MLERSRGLNRMTSQRAWAAGSTRCSARRASAPREALLTLPVARIRPGKYQPRTHMDQQALAELAESIRSQGVMQPILVRPVDRGRYEIIAGERRWRAAQMAGLRRSARRWCAKCPTKPRSPWR